jgi:hypothetical protein
MIRPCPARELERHVPSSISICRLACLIFLSVSSSLAVVSDFARFGLAWSHMGGFLSHGRMRLGFLAGYAGLCNNE